MNQFLPEGRLFREQKKEMEDITPERLARAMESGEILEAVALRCDRAHTLHFRLGGMEAVMPREEAALGIAEGATREIAVMSRVGKPTAFVVEALAGEDGLLRPVLSRRKAQERALEWLMSLDVGTVIPATVTHLEPFGAFVDVGCGVPSLVPLGEISVSRIPHPLCRFKTGQEIYVAVKSLLPERSRLLLSHRELLGTWRENAARFAPGEVVTGTVRGVLDYGIFVELAPNLPALAEFQGGILDGDQVSVYIKSILTDKEKIKLQILERLEPAAKWSPPAYFITKGNVRGWKYHSYDVP